MAREICLWRLVVAGVLALAATAGSRSLAGSVAAQSSAWQTLAAKARDQRAVRIVVGLQTPFVPEGRLAGAGDRAQQRAEIGVARSSLLRRLPPSRLRTVKRFQTVPLLALEVDELRLGRLASMPEVTTVAED